MGRRPVENKKLPGEYPQFAFRLSSTAKAELMKLIEEVQDRMNKRRPEGDPWVNKNDVILRALRNGLKHLKSSN